MTTSTKTHWRAEVYPRTSTVWVFRDRDPDIVFEVRLAGDAHTTALLWVDYLNALEDAADRMALAERVLGVPCADNKCEGCAAEMTTAKEIMRDALARLRELRKG